MSLVVIATAAAIVASGPWEMEQAVSPGTWLPAEVP